MLDSGALSWPSPAVLPLDAWLVSLLGEFLFNSSKGLTLLSRTRSLALWESVVLKDTKKAKTPMPFTNIMVRDSYKAYALLKEYLAPPLPSSSIYLSEESRAFMRWSRRYESLLEQRGLVSPCLITKTVADYIKERSIQVRGEVVLAGFDEITPVTALLISALKSSGVGVDFWPEEPTMSGEIPEELITALDLRAFADIESEVIAVARWVRQKAARGTSVAVIVPNLSDNLSLIEREFGAELAPGCVLTGRRQSARELFAISSARPLLDTPIVQSALDILSIHSNETNQPASQLFALLRNPYISLSQEESFDVATLGLDPRYRRHAETSLGDILSLILNGEGSLLADFKLRLIRWIDELKGHNASARLALPGQWTAHFTSILKILNWPDIGITLTSEEFQATAAFYELLAEFAGLDDITGPMGADEATSRLRKMCAYRTHQPGGPETSILILDPLEAGGLEFDLLWLMGASDKAFPRSPAPNPFIPFNLLRELELPGSSHAREGEFARVLLKRILSSAPEVVVSFSEEIDGSLQRVSPYLVENSPVAASSLSPLPSSRYKDLLFSNAILETVSQRANVPFYPGEMERIRGGTNVIKDQSLCPFRAFAHYRLGACDPDAPEPGLSNMERGSLIHSALKLFWQEVKGSRALIELKQSNLLARKIAHAVSVALEPYRRRGHAKNHYLNLEQRRLEALLGEWLEVEAKREPFSVKVLEEDFRLTFGPLAIKVKIDRVDSVEGAGEVVIDYKSGGCSRYDWFSKRPKDPQMLIYNQTGHYSATAYAAIKHLECTFKGLASLDAIMPGIKGFDSDKKLEKYIEAGMTYDDLILSWKDAIEELAASFCAGEVVVDPIDLGKNTCACTYCDLKPLCRIFTALEPGGKG